MVENSDEKKETVVDKKPTISQDELAQLNAEIEAANKSLVSEEVRKVLEQERAAAKKEAEKEFATNQRIKELEEHNKRIEQEKIEAQRKAAEELAKLKATVDQLVTSRAPVTSKNPFNEPVNKQESPAPKIWELPSEQIDELEKGSFLALLNRNRQ